jgi:hypothetical protein
MNTFFSLRTSIVAALLALYCAATLQAQDNPLGDLRIYGYMQVLGYNERTENVLTTPMGTITNTSERNTFSLQQMNLFLSKPLGEHFSAFWNLRFPTPRSVDGEVSASKKHGQITTTARH